MQLLLVHLSDAHFHANRGANTLLHKADSLIGALDDAGRGSDAVILLFTGDIARTGQASEYVHAGAFCKALASGIEQRDGQRAVHSVIVPGNHDCNFALDNDVRRIILRDLTATPRAEAKILEQMLAVQTDYFKFTEKHAPTLSSSYFTTTHRIKISERTVGFHLINSAWMSSLKEVPASIRFPTNQLPGDELQDCDLVIALLHHPPSWFTPEDALRLRRTLSLRCDLVLTGHEHSGALRRETYDFGAETYWLEGELLQQPNEHSTSALRVLSVDMASRAVTANALTWNKDHYALQESFNIALLRNPARSSHIPRLTANHERFIDDVGMTLPATAAGTKPKLAELFVWPDFRQLDFKSPSATPISVRGRALAKRTIGATSVLMIPDKGGRTTLCKVLFDHLFVNGLSPVYLDATHFLKGRKAPLIEQALESFTRQYETPTLDHYRQLPRSERAVIIDNLHMHSAWGADLLKAILEELTHFAETIVLAIDDSWQFHIFTNRELSEVLDGTQAYIGMELTYPQRATLVRQWVLRYQQEASPRDMVRRERAVAQVLGTEFIPSHPGLVLLLLNALDATQAGVESGALGHLHHAMVVRCLQDVFDAEQLETVINILAQFAFVLFRESRVSFSTGEFFEWLARHEERYALQRQDAGRLLERLIAADMLRKEDDEVYFRYRYLFHFFAGYALARSEEDESRMVHDLATRAATPDVASILLFLCFFSTSQDTLDALNRAATECLSAFSEFDFDNERGMGTSASNREPIRPDHSHVGARATAANETRNDSDSYDGRRTKIDLQADATAPEVVTAYALIGILGEALKNQAGSILADRKKLLAQACFSLGQRYIQATAGELEASRGAVEQVVLRILQRTAKKGGGSEELAPDEFQRITDVFIGMLRCLLATGGIRRVAESIGTRKLSRTFAEITSDDASTGHRLCGAAVAMDGEPIFPRAELLKLYRQKTSPFVRNVFRQLIWLHFVLYEEDWKLRQRVADEFEIPELKSRSDQEIGKLS